MFSALQVSNLIILCYKSASVSMKTSSLCPAVSFDADLM